MNTQTPHLHVGTGQHGPDLAQTTTHAEGDLDSIGMRLRHELEVALELVRERDDPADDGLIAELETLAAIDNDTDLLKHARQDPPARVKDGHLYVWDCSNHECAGWHLW